MPSPRVTDNAQPAETAEERVVGPRRPYLTFLCSEEHYAASILKIREILSVGPITRVPATPAWIRGVMNLRGRVLPVVDLAAKLDLPEAPITSRSCIVIVEVDLVSKQIVMGMVVDAVEDVIELAPEEIEPPPAFGTRMHVGYLLGMTRTQEGDLVLVIDADRVLSVNELLTAAALEECGEEGLPRDAEHSGEPTVLDEDSGSDESLE